MKFILTLLVAFFIALPVNATEIQMGYEGNLVFEPNEVTINAGDTVWPCLCKRQCNNSNSR